MPIALVTSSVLITFALMFYSLGLTGQIALWLMLAHAIWATWVSSKGTEDARQGFHKYSIVVWLVWLIPYFGGMVLAMHRS